MSVRPGLATDALVMQSVTLQQGAGNVIVRETPSCRGFWYGNALVLDTPPAAGEHVAWLVRHAQTFSGIPIGANVVLWEVARPGAAAPAAVDDSYAVAASSVLALARLRPVEPRGAFERRPLESERDWAAASDLNLAAAPVEQRYDEEFWRWQIGVVRRDAGDGRATVIGAFDQARLIAFAGLYASAEWMRLTTPVTEDGYRGRGIFAALLGDAIASAQVRFPRARTIVCAETGGDPERIYRYLGFERVGMQFSLLRRLRWREQISEVENI